PRQVGIVVGESDMDMRHRPAAASRQGEGAAARGQERSRRGRFAVQRERDAPFGMADVVLEMKGDECVRHQRRGLDLSRLESTQWERKRAVGSAYCRLPIAPCCTEAPMN